MTSFDWNTKFATEFEDQYGTKILFYPLHEKETGAMNTTKNGMTIGGEYTFKVIDGTPHLGWKDADFILSPTDDGFDLLTGETITYRFKRTV